MTNNERKLVTATVLAELAKAMLEVKAAGPCGYWNNALATQLNGRAIDLIAETESHAGERDA